MKKLLMMIMIAAIASLNANAGHYAMVSAFAPGQIPIADEQVNGVRINLIYGDCMSVNGLDVGLIGRTRARFNGLQIAGCSVVGTDMAGCQLGLLNFVDTGFSGFQFSLWNDVGGTARGLQIGLVNFANDLKGAQIGLLNLINEPNPTVKCLPILNFGW